ncbi:MAG: beta-barrel porin-2 [Bacteroidetes bacterium]|nr:beta-barrel porin-2 [Bacteroidota bacterium]
MNKSTLYLIILCVVPALSMAQNNVYINTQPPLEKNSFGRRLADGFLDRRHVRDTSSAEPFSQYDLTWMNGNDRRHEALLATKYFTGSVMIDVNYTASGHHPKDNTVVGSTALARNNEIELSLAAFGGDFNYKNVRARLMFQVGTRTTLIPRNDASWNRGGGDLKTAYRYLSEAYAGYHFNAMHGINLDAGLFMSYIGLNSYYNAENWVYQPSFTSDNTPWFFNGIRLQMFPSRKLKMEVWLINGWQSYGKFNTMPGFGYQLTWSPRENVRLVTNNYFGTDVANNPHAYRFHTDNSLQIRYYNQEQGRFSRAAFCVTGDLGFQKGGGLGGFGLMSNAPESNFLSAMVYNRFWFGKNHFAWTMGGGVIHNPGRYLVLAPSGDADPNINPATGQAIGTHPYSLNPGDRFDGWDVSTNIDWMPNELITFRLEVVHRESSVPYFAGHGGVTSPDGYNGTALTLGWAPDLVKQETRFIGALLVRF